MAALVIVDSYLGDRALPSTINTPLLVNIEPHSTVVDVTESPPVLTAPERDYVKQQEVAKPDVPPIETPRVTPPTEMPTPLAEVEPMPAGRPSLEMATPGLFVAPVISPAIIMVHGVQAERSVPHTVEISPQQDEMLRQKLNKWANELRELSEESPTLTWTHDGKEYLAEFRRVAIEDEMAVERMVVEISTQEGGQRLSSQVQMKRLAFSNFAQFVNRWDPTVEIHNDELDGRFHANSSINLTYDRKAKPLFHSKVTTTSRRVAVRGGARGRHDQIFLGGLETGVQRIPLPERFAPFPDEPGEGARTMHRFETDTRVIFTADGGYTWQPLDGESPAREATLSDDTAYFIGAENATLFVRGTVNGKVLVYAAERIVIEDDLLYERHPAEEANADDFLGLVSDKNVEIAHSKVTGPGDLVIHAAIYAKRRFSVRGYRSRDTGVLDLYGSLSAGSISASEPRFSTRIRFDRRFENLRPPGFPQTDRYEVETWNAAWDIEPAE